MDRFKHVCERLEEVKAENRRLRDRQARLSMDMLPVLVEQQTYFVAAVMEGKHEKVLELCREGLKGWDRLANSPRSVTVTGRYDVMITPRHASCSCKAYQYSRTRTQTCKHLQAAVLLLLNSGISFK